ncbi:MAG: hypothetical protein H8D65_01195 [Spirochaetes bacterium]|nr:hypothetical protein [Spirochaetota bacterium]
MKPNDDQIHEIAENLDFGMKCFFNKKTGEITCCFVADQWIGSDTELQEEDIQKIEDHSEDYIEFYGLDTHESFELMADFADCVDDFKLKERLFNTLNRPKPFRSFKDLIDNSGKYREQWFAYKHMRYVQMVREQIELSAEQNEH